MKRYIKNAQAVLGFALHRSEIAARLEENTRILMKHLVKLWMFPEASEVDHWRKEVYSFLNQVPRLKGVNKFPSGEFIFNSTFVPNESCIDDLYEDVYDDYTDNHTLVRTNCDAMHQVIEDYYIWISDVLSRRGLVSYKKVSQKLEELGL